LRWEHADAFRLCILFADFLQRLDSDFEDFKKEILFPDSQVMVQTKEH